MLRPISLTTGGPDEGDDIDASSADRGEHGRPTSERPERRADRAMNVLQYGLAILAIVGALLLGSLR